MKKLILTSILFLFCPAFQLYADSKNCGCESINELESIVEKNVETLFCLGVLYGREGRRGESFAWYKKAAELGDPQSQYKVARAYSIGEGVAVDQIQAFSWYLKAANNGDRDSLLEVAERYNNGEGTKQDAVLAFEWFHKAYERGSFRGNMMIGHYYFNGVGVPRDVVKARKIYQDSNLIIPLGSANQKTATHCYYSQRELDRVLLLVRTFYSSFADLIPLSLKGVVVDEGVSLIENYKILQKSSPSVISFQVYDKNNFYIGGSDYKQHPDSSVDDIVITSPKEGIIHIIGPLNDGGVKIGTLEMEIYTGISSKCYDQSQSVYNASMFSFFLQTSLDEKTKELVESISLLLSRHFSGDLKARVLDKGAGMEGYLETLMRNERGRGFESIQIYDENMKHIDGRGLMLKDIQASDTTIVSQTDSEGVRSISPIRDDDNVLGYLYLSIK